MRPKSVEEQTGARLKYALAHFKAASLSDVPRME